MWRRDFFQFPCYSQEVKIPQKFIVREGGKGKREKVLCNFVRGHNRYLVSAQQEIASRRDFLAGELPCWGQILQNNMKVKNVLGCCPFATSVYWVHGILGESNWFEFHWLIMVQSVTFVWILIRTNIRIYSCQENDTNEYPNIFVWNFLTRTNIRIYSYQNFDTNEYPNIFVSTFWYERISQ